MMLALGPYRFSLNTSAYQTYKRTSDYRWPAVERIGESTLLQGIGPGIDRIELEGIIYPHFRGGFKQLDLMREAALSYKPHLLINGQGHILGQWVIAQIEEVQSNFLINGISRKVEFRLSLERYGDYI